MIKKILITIATLGALLTGQAMAGPLTNVTVTGTYSGGGIQFANGSTQPIDFNFEFETEDSNQNNFFFVDFDESGLVSVFNNISDLVSPPNQILTFSFIGLDPSNSILGVSPGNDLALSVLNSNTIKIDLSNVVWGDSFSSLSGQLVFGVAEPGTLALLGLAMLSLVSLRRRGI